MIRAVTKKALAVSDGNAQCRHIWVLPAVTLLLAIFTVLAITNVHQFQGSRRGQKPAKTVRSYVAITQRAEA